jgi:hypothetical protein
VYRAVTMALLEINEYNAAATLSLSSGRTKRTKKAACFILDIQEISWSPFYKLSSIMWVNWKLSYVLSCEHTVASPSYTIQETGAV